MIVGPARADTVCLENGSTLTGEIMKETDDAIHLKMHGGILRIGRSSVVEIVRDAPKPAKRRRDVPADAVDLHDVASSGAVTVKARGKSIRVVTFTIEHGRNAPGRFFLAAGARGIVAAVPALDARIDQPYGLDFLTLELLRKFRLSIVAGGGEGRRSPDRCEDLLAMLLRPAAPA